VAGRPAPGEDTQLAQTAWWLSELTRHSPRDIAEAGRELGRFDSRPWLTSVSVPAASVITTRDRSVAPAKQRELAAAIGAEVFEAPIDHLEVTSRAVEYNPALLDAVAAVRVAGAVPASSSSGAAERQARSSGQ